MQRETGRVDRGTHLMQRETGHVDRGCPSFFKQLRWLCQQPFSQGGAVWADHHI